MCILQALLLLLYGASAPFWDNGHPDLLPPTFSFPSCHFFNLEQIRGIPPGPDCLMLSIPPSPLAKRLKYCARCFVCVCVRVCPGLMEEPKMMFQSYHSCCCLGLINIKCFAWIFCYWRLQWELNKYGWRTHTRHIQNFIKKRHRLTFWYRHDGKISQSYVYNYCVNCKDGIAQSLQ